MCVFICVCMYVRMPLCERVSNLVSVSSMSERRTDARPLFKYTKPPLVLLQRSIKKPAFFSFSTYYSIIPRSGTGTRYLAIYLRLYRFLIPPKFFFPFRLNYLQQLRPSNRVDLLFLLNFSSRYLNYVHRLACLFTRRLVHSFFHQRL